jgi:hypothetical protein
MDVIWNKLPIIIASIIVFIIIEARVDSGKYEQTDEAEFLGNLEKVNSACINAVTSLRGFRVKEVHRNYIAVDKRILFQLDSHISISLNELYNGNTRVVVIADADHYTYGVKGRNKRNIARIIHALTQEFYHKEYPNET